MSDDPRIEAVARALAEYDGQNPDAGVPNIDLTADPLWLRYEPRAHAALAAADAAAWRTIETAPMDSTPIRALIDGWDHECVIAFQDGFLDESGEECGSWVCLEGEPPTCWTDGVCWAANEDELASARPLFWKLMEQDT